MAFSKRLIFAIRGNQEALSGVICFTRVFENDSSWPKLYLNSYKEQNTRFSGDASTGLHLVKTWITNNRIYWDYQHREGHIMVLLNCLYSFLICSAKLKLCPQTVHSD